MTSSPHTQKPSTHGPLSGAYACDVSDSAQVQAMVEAVSTDLGAIDVLVNNAGVDASGSVFDLTDRGVGSRVPRQRV